jgi:KaiC/GvpD/RAD55 family RecA-like ATPase
MLEDAIPGLDNIIQSEIFQGSQILVTGGMGTLKSSFVFNALSNYLSRTNEYGIYMTFEEDRASLLRSAKSLGITTTENLFISDYSTLREQLISEDSLAEVNIDTIETIKTVLKTHLDDKGDKLTCFALDSLNALYTFTDTVDIKRKLYHFFSYLRKLGVTSLVVMEETSPEERLYARESYLVDGVIHLGTFETQGKVARYIEIIKMRAVKHGLEKYQIDVSGEGLKILGTIYE